MILSSDQDSPAGFKMMDNSRVGRTAGGRAQLINYSLHAVDVGEIVSLNIRNLES